MLKRLVGAAVFLVIKINGGFMGRATSLGELINNEQCYNNVFNFKLNNNVNNVSMWKTRKTNRISPYEAEAKAGFLVERLKAPHCRNFFLKCIYHLSEAEIQDALESATRPYVKSQVKYFNRVCKIKLSERGL